MLCIYIYMNVMYIHIYLIIKLLFIFPSSWWRFISNSFYLLLALVFLNHILTDYLINKITWMILLLYISWFSFIYFVIVIRNLTSCLEGLHPWQSCRAGLGTSVDFFVKSFQTAQAVLTGISSPGEVNTTFVNNK